MKTKIFPFRSFGAALVVAGALTAAPARADIVATYWANERVPEYWQPHDYLDGVSPSNVEAHGSVQFYFEPGTSATRSWGTEMNDINYVGFTLTADPGFQLNFTDMKFSTVVSGGSVDAFRWGYRVNDGSGFGAWNYGTTYSIGDTGFSFVSSSLNEKVWDFADFSTTGSVEFGLFAKSPTGVVAELVVTQPRHLYVNGSVNAVPEPSTYALIAIAGTVALVVARRRQANS